jgi:inner membrane protein
VAVWLVLSAATASHGVLDSITNGGPGVALFAPFDTGRYLLPWRPVPVSPISVRGLLTARGAAVLRAEVLMLWLPALLLILVATRRRWR